MSAPTARTLSEPFRLEWRHGALIDVDAERELAAWAFSEAAEDPGLEAEFGPLRRLPDEDDGLDRYDPAQRLYEEMARERDPNEALHDRFRGTEWA